MHLRVWLPLRRQCMLEDGRIRAALHEESGVLAHRGRYLHGQYDMRMRGRKRAERGRQEVSGCCAKNSGRMHGVGAMHGVRVYVVHRQDVSVSRGLSLRTRRDEMLSQQRDRCRLRR